MISYCGIKTMSDSEIDSEIGSEIEDVNEGSYDISHGSSDKFIKSNEKTNIISNPDIHYGNIDFVFKTSENKLEVEAFNYYDIWSYYGCYELNTYSDCFNDIKIIKDNIIDCFNKKQDPELTHELMVLDVGIVIILRYKDKYYDEKTHIILTKDNSVKREEIIRSKVMLLRSKIKHTL